MKQPRHAMLLLAVVASLLSGCGIQEPSIELDAAGPVTSAHGPITNSSPVIDVGRYAATRPSASLMRLVDVYATLRVNVAADTDREHLTAALRRSTRTHAADVLREMTASIERARQTRQPEIGQVVAVTADRASDQAAAYAIVRFGRYDAEGRLLGQTRVAVYTVGLQRRADGRYLVSSWQVAQ